MHANANGLTLNYSLDGPEGAPVVTLSHSLAANLNMWEPQIEALSAHYRVLRFDTRGHDGSDAPDGRYDMAMLAGDAAALLDALGVARTHFIGLSLGGMIGQTLALEQPDRLLSLALCDTTSVVPPEARAMWDQRVALGHGHRGFPGVAFGGARRSRCCRAGAKARHRRQQSSLVWTRPGAVRAARARGRFRAVWRGVCGATSARAAAGPSTR